MYELTEKGKDLIPTLLELGSWGLKHNARTLMHKNIARRMKGDRDALVAGLKASLK
jgi:DNA-binding HxlR family transcriptional regulator